MLSLTVPHSFRPSGKVPIDCVRARQVQMIFHPSGKVPIHCVRARQVQMIFSAGAVFLPKYDATFFAVNTYNSKCSRSVRIVRSRGADSDHYGGEYIRLALLCQHPGCSAPSAVYFPPFYSEC